MSPDADVKTIYSSTPLEAPYPSTEPKSAAAKANVMRMMGTTISGFPEALLLKALDEIQENYSGEWCLPRQISPNVLSGQGKKRKLNHDEGEHGLTLLEEPDIEIPVNCRSFPAVEVKTSFDLRNHTKNVFSNMHKITNQLMHNAHSTPVHLLIESTGQSYTIPPDSAFYLANISGPSSADFSEAIQAFYPTPTASAGPGQFDIILLDPPWDNRSARRSRTYDTIRQRSDPMIFLQDMLGKHIAPNGLVACWTTNKTSARESAMEAFKAWDVELIEEWAWLKTTIKGIPVTELHGLWRKPYEILLLARRSDMIAAEDDRINVPPYEVIKRVIVAVPDFHSRKPCLKDLLELTRLHLENYRALEIFARQLTTQWCSWGDESIKYNWQGHWPAT